MLCYSNLRLANTTELSGSLFHQRLGEAFIKTLDSFQNSSNLHPHSPSPDVYSHEYLPFPRFLIYEDVCK